MGSRPVLPADIPLPGTLLPDMEAPDILLPDMLP
jgi:hypothetical protein